MVDVETYGALIAYVKNSLEGMGALKGAPCEIQSITSITGGNRVTFVWEDGDGVSHTDTMDVMDGADGTKVEASQTNGHIEIDDVDTTVYDDSAVTTAIDNIEDELSTDYATVEGNPINFSTLSAQKSKSTILSVEPIQDLHGYDKPWVGGAGKNLLPLTVNGIKSENTNNGTWNGNVFTHINGPTFTILTDSDNNVTGIKVTGTSTAVSLLKLSSVFTVSSEVKFNGLQSVGSYETFGMQILGSDGETSLQGMYNTIDYTQPSGTYSLRIRIANSYAIPTGGIEFKPMVRLSTVTDSTFQPYTNIASINGRTEIGILGCGKNLFDKNKAISGYFNPDGSIHTSNSWKYEFISVIPNTDYTVSGTISNTSVYHYWFDKYNNCLGTASQHKNGKITSPLNARYLGVITNIANDSDIDTMQVEIGSSPTTYEPYTESNSLIISLGQTVYGGTLDVENGVLVVDKVSVDLSTLDYSPSAAENHVFRSDSLIGVIKEPNITSIPTNAICSIYYAKTFASLEIQHNGAFAIASDTHNNHGRFVCVDYRYSTINDYVAGVTGQKLCYELKTPITIQLTPNEISLLEGVNNISTDGDKITLTYRDGSVATLGDLTSAVDSLDSKIDESKILTDTVTGDKYILVVTNGVLDIQQISN